MPKLVEKKVAPFVPVQDGPEISEDPTNRRALALFDALRKRNVGPERAAYAISQIHAKAAGDGHPAPKAN